MNKKILLCFFENLKEESDLYQFLDQCDNHGYEVHLYHNTSVQDFQPHDILYELDILIDENNKQDFLFFTNIKKLYCIVYRLYHQIFEQFLFYQNIEEIVYYADEIYEKLMNVKITEEENLYKPVYTNSLAENDLFGMQQKKPLDIETIMQEVFDNSTNLSVKYYAIEGFYYLFEPTKGTNKLIINNSSQVAQTYSNTKYIYCYRKDIIDDVFDQLKNGFTTLKNNYEVYFQNLEKLANQEMAYQRQMLICILSDWDFMKNDRYTYSTILLLSFLSKYTMSACCLEKLLKIIFENNTIPKEERYFLYQQLKTLLFMQPSLGSAETGKLLKEIYKKIYKEYECAFQEEFAEIPQNERNKELVVIFTYMFLGEKHPPTHTTIERAYTIAKELKKQVVIINTHENVTDFGTVPFFNTRCANFIEDYNDITNITYKDMLIPFYQIEGPMPSSNSISEVIEFIKNLKPYYILNIGGSSITADLCGKLVPELSMGVVFSTLPITVGKLSILGRNVKASEWEQLYQDGYEKDSIIESTFTFELTPQSTTIKKADLSLPEDRFLMIVVGNRLNEDVNEEYISHISETFSYGTHLVIAGEFTNYQMLCEKYPLFKEHSTSVGYFSDMLAMMEICDLYVNPRRMGGGFSITEAFYQGKPGVTIEFGDVAVAAGQNFCVNDYEELVETVKRYCTDPDFYNIMALKAKNRARILTDSGKAFKEIVEKAEKSKFFF